MKRLTLPEIQTALAEVVFMPGWHMEAYQSAHQGPYIRIRAEVENAFEPGAKVVLDIKSPLPPMPDAAYFREWLAWRLEGIAVHEVHEWLRWRESGKPLFDPHAEGVDEPADGAA